MTSENINKLAKMFNHNDKISQRQASRKYNCHRSLIQKTLQKYTNIKYHKKTKIPKRTETQQKDAKRKCGILFKKYKNCDWIIDEESYFTLSHSSINENNTFYSSNIKDTPLNIKYKTATKYESKLLVWICICEFGISTPYFQESGLAINQEIYLNQCIKKRLLPFIKKYHDDQNYIFWPDLASSHYAKTVINFLNENQIQYVFKEDNPANVPECRPIEDFWPILKGQVYQNNWTALTLEKLQTRIKLCLNKIDKKFIQNLISSVPKRLSQVQKKGVVEYN